MLFYLSVVALGSADILTLSKLGINTGGAFVYTPTGEMILEAFKTLTSFIADSYVIEWEAETE